MCLCAVEHNWRNVLCPIPQMFENDDDLEEMYTWGLAIATYINVYQHSKMEKYVSSHC